MDKLECESIASNRVLAQQPGQFSLLDGTSGCCRAGLHMTPGKVAANPPSSDGNLGKSASPPVRDPSFIAMPTLESRDPPLWSRPHLAIRS